MTAQDPVQDPQPSTDGTPSIGGTAQTLRPTTVPPTDLDRLLLFLAEQGIAVRTDPSAAGDRLPRRRRPSPGTHASDEEPGGEHPEAVRISGISMDSREVQPGDLYVALPGANAHGAQFARTAARSGAAAVLTDSAGLDLVRESGTLLPVVVVETVREAVGPLAAHVYRSQPQDPAAQRLFAVTGTNGKTTTTYMINALLERLGHTTGLIGTIEILAGQDTIPSRLTTPESTHVHALVTVMRERGITATSMEVSSHALDYRRVDGLVYDVAGFTNLTQDHLDLHGSMEAYFRSKAQLFSPAHSRRAVVTVDDSWGVQMAEAARTALGKDAVVALATGHGRGAPVQATEPAADWSLVDVAPEGIGHRFVLRHATGRELPAGTGLPADFNVSNAALALAMVAESGIEHERLLEALEDPGALTPLVPGRMQVVSQEPVAIVDFAHNPDALQRALEAVDPAGPSAPGGDVPRPAESGGTEDGRVIVVFGATGQRDQLKRPIMGAVAARHADVVIVTDDDPHHEPPAPIREAVAEGARRAVAEGARARSVEDVAPRAEAIRRAVQLAGPADSILVAGRGHEVSQDVDGVENALDDREELRAALAAVRPGEGSGRTPSAGSSSGGAPAATHPQQNAHQKGTEQA